MKRLVYNYAKRLVSPSSGPTNLTFFVTGACAFQCKTCFYWHHLNEADNELTLDEIERLAPSLAGCSWIALTGGEPLQRRDFGGVLEAVMRKARPPYLTLVTNGFHPKRLEESLRNALPFLDGGVLRVSVSLDGVGALHDEIRGVPGSFERAIESLRLLHSLRRTHAGLQVMVCTVYHRHNQQRIDEIPEYLAREVGDVDWDFQMIRGTPHEASAAQDVDVSGFFEKKRLHAARVANRPRPTAIERLIAEKNRAVAVMYSENFRRERRRDCRAGTRHAVIRETGEVVSCEIGEFSMGNVRDHGMDLRRLWNAEQAERTRRKIRGDGCACVHDCNLTTDLFFTRAGLSAAAKAFFPRL